MDAKNTIFFNVDTQSDFMHADGALYVKDAELITPFLRELTELAEEKNIKVINTADFHTEQSVEISETPDYATTFPKHCMVYSEGADFIDETNPKKFYEDNYYIVNYTDSKIDENKFHRARNIIVLKDQFDVFVGSKLIEEVLMQIQRKQVVENIVIYGVATSICLKYAINGLLARKFKVQLVIDAIQDLPGYYTEYLYAIWINKGVTLTTTDKIEEMLR